MKRTLLRVKRRRDEPAHDLFKLDQSSLPSEAKYKKRLKNHHPEGGTEQIIGMMNDIGVAAPTSKHPVLGNNDTGPSTQPLPPPILFRRMSGDYFNHESQKRKTCSYSEISQVNLVEANLKGELKGGSDGDASNQTVYQRDSKRKKTSLTLHMVESRMILEKDFWKMHSKCTDASSLNGQLAVFKLGASISETSVKGTNMGKTALRERMKRNANKESGINTGPKSKSTPSNSHVILDPLSRKVDDSLCAIYKGFGSDNNDAEANIMQHIQMLQLSIAACVPNMAKYVNWACSDGSGSILHQIALVNSIASARELCRLFGTHLDFSVEDNAGKSAIMMAKEVQAENVLEIYECYGGQTIIDDQRESDQEEDGYVYDVYCLEESSLCFPESDVKTIEPLPTKNDRTSNEASLNQTRKLTAPSAAQSNPTVVNVQGGVGYWLDGNFVIDVDGAEDFDDSDLEGDDYDSNREDCDGNDYPDDDYDDCGSSHNREHYGTLNDHLSQYASNFKYHDDDFSHDDDDDDYDKLSFRNRKVQFNEIKNMCGANVFQQNNLYEDDELGKDEDYRGFMYADTAGWDSKIPCNNNVAFDPNLDLDE